MHASSLLPIIVATLLATAVRAQTCPCSTTFNWMVQTFEENDAGFQLVVDRKGAAEYAKHTEAMRSRAQQINDVMACTEVLNEWLQWFRRGHIGIGPTEQALVGPHMSNGQDAAQPSTTAVRVIKGSEAGWKKQWSKAKSMEPFEGIWNMGAYRVALVKDDVRMNGMAAVILSSRNANWKPGQVKAEFGGSPEVGYSGIFYMGDHSARPMEMRLVGSSGAMLEMNGLWVREFPPTELSKTEKGHVRFASAEEPYLEPLSESTLYLRIPSFAFEQKVLIDSVLAANDALIRKTANFIIDIRNGTGGSDASYGGLIPYLYSGPMRTVGVKLRATELNAAGYEQYADMMGRDSESGKRCTEIATRMRAALGTWLELDEQPWSVDSSHTVLPFPQRVGIICNGGNGSTDEQFLLEARTSYKVKLFGHPTMGSLDVSNMRGIISPDGCFQLGYTMSMSHRLPHMPVDVMGIQPDHYLDEGIPQLDWVGYVQRVLEGR
ncbi:MAG: hypothetical protein KF905_15125 [Flavobacteriales bacterium]|nr:hypothetical protein [Flavobacteriales bacterium]